MIDGGDRKYWSGSSLSFCPSSFPTPSSSSTRPTSHSPAQQSLSLLDSFSSLISLIRGQKPAWRNGKPTRRAICGSMFSSDRRWDYSLSSSVSPLCSTSSSPDRDADSISSSSRSISLCRSSSLSCPFSLQFNPPILDQA